MKKIHSILLSILFFPNLSIATLENLENDENVRLAYQQNQAVLEKYSTPTKSPGLGHRLLEKSYNWLGYQSSDSEKLKFIDLNLITFQDNLKRHFGLGKFQSDNLTINEFIGIQFPFQNRQYNKSGTVYYMIYDLRYGYENSPTTRSECIFTVQPLSFINMILEYQKTAKFTKTQTCKTTLNGEAKTLCYYELTATIQNQKYYMWLELLRNKSKFSDDTQKVLKYEKAQLFKNSISQFDYIQNQENNFDPDE